MQVLSICSFFSSLATFAVIKADKRSGEEKDWSGVMWRGVPAVSKRRGGERAREGNYFSSLSTLCL